MGRGGEMNWEGKEGKGMGREGKGYSPKPQILAPPLSLWWPIGA